MGVDVAVANFTKKQYIENDCRCGSRMHWVVRYGNQMSQLLIFLMAEEWSGDNVSVVNDMDNFPWFKEKGWKNITVETRKQLLYEFSSLDPYINDKEGEEDPFDNLKQCAEEAKELKKMFKQFKKEKNEH
jgi:hypothetical protein